ncbi:LysR family transcriptional regulator [Asaia sp. W19]|uniref:LysR family transcriptional regulator n=1 Tax=unclassified Asaia TaxID=2685023 RepID=UPI000F8E27C2|nr:LysR family transcriptional regulator [Asaia sp. W19]RUT25721.1 LysR family transcriptional regulator [Asaia sp. W19]
MNNASYNQLVVFHAIAREGSLTKAARTLAMGPPSVSKSLKLLEESVGATLFRRTTRRLAITETGQALLEASSTGLMALQQAITSIRDLNREIAGPLRITVARFAYKLYLAPVIAQFIVRNPGITLEISVNDGTVDLLSEGYDIGIRFYDRLQEGMVARRLSGPVREGLYMSPEYLSRHGMPQTIEELEQHPIIGYRFTTSNRMAPLVLQGRVTLCAQMPLVTNDIDVIADGIRNSLGIGRLFSPIRKLQNDSDKLIPVLEETWITYPPVYLYYSKNTDRLKQIRAFCEFVTEAVRKRET